MQIKVLFDSHALDKNLHGGWGISFLVGGEILFDTGERGDWLLENMEKMKVSYQEIKHVIISHDHWDHTRGLWPLLKQNQAIKVYACPGFSSHFKKSVRSIGAGLIEVNGLTKIAEGIHTTGEIAGEYAGKYMAEQALVIESEKGLVVLTGCTHPKIVKILENVKKNIGGDIYLVMGGFHLIKKDRRVIALIANRFQELDVEKVAPTHCTGKEAEEIFEGVYKDNFIPLKVGVTVEI